MGDALLVKRVKKLAKEYGFEIITHSFGFKVKESEGSNVLWYTEKSSDGKRLTLNWAVWGSEDILSFYRELIPSVSWKMNGHEILWRARDMNRWEPCLYIDLPTDPEFVWKITP